MLHDVPSPAAVLIATGSEVGLAMDAAAELARHQQPVRVVSMPCVEVFDGQDAGYREDVLPTGVPRVVVEAGATGGWYRHAAGGTVIGIDQFGESAPGPALFEHFDVDVDAVVAAVRRLVPVRRDLPVRR